MSPRWVFRRWLGTAHQTSRSAKEVITLKYTWTIENFPFFLLDETVKSSKFSSETDDGTQWILKLHPNGNIEANKDYISVFLGLYSCPGSEVLVNARICIIGASGKLAGCRFPYEPRSLKPGFALGVSN